MSENEPTSSDFDDAFEESSDLRDVDLDGDDDGAGTIICWPVLGRAWGGIIIPPWPPPLPL